MARDDNPVRFLLKLNTTFALALCVLTEFSQNFAKKSNLQTLVFKKAFDYGRFRTTLHLFRSAVDTVATARTYCRPTCRISLMTSLSA